MSSAGSAGACSGAAWSWSVTGLLTLVGDRLGTGPHPAVGESNVDQVVDRDRVDGRHDVPVGPLDDRIAAAHRRQWRQGTDPGQLMTHVVSGAIEPVREMPTGPVPHIEQRGSSLVDQRDRRCEGRAALELIE